LRRTKKRKILFAAVDIGYRIEHYTKFINENFSDTLVAESFSKYIVPASHYKTTYTYSCPIDKTHPLRLYAYCFYFFIVSLFRYDIFHFFSGETILTRKLRPFELFIYKLFGKRIVMHFVGSDLRNEKFLFWKEKNIRQFIKGETFAEMNLPWQKKLIADTEKYADAVLVSTPDLKHFVKNAVYYPVMLDFEKFMKEAKPPVSKPSASDEIVILHAPSNTTIKGTALIHDTLKKLVINSPYKIRLILPGEKFLTIAKTYPVSRYELFELYKEADIIIDQLTIGWYGLQSIEGLLMGNEVISYVDEELKGYLSPDCPIEVADANTLEEVIIKCIKKIQLNKRRTQESIVEWVKKNHTIEYNGKILLDAWGELNN